MAQLVLLKIRSDFQFFYFLPISTSTFLSMATLFSFSLPRFPILLVSPSSCVLLSLFLKLFPSLPNGENNWSFCSFPPPSPQPSADHAVGAQVPVDTVTDTRSAPSRSPVPVSSMQQSEQQLLWFCSTFWESTYFSSQGINLPPLLLQYPNLFPFLFIR